MIGVSQVVIYVGSGAAMAAIFLIVVYSDSVMAKRRAAHVSKFARVHGLSPILEPQPVPVSGFSLFQRKANNITIAEQMSYPDSNDSMFVFIARSRSVSGESHQYFRRACALIELPNDFPAVRVAQRTLLSSTGAVRGDRSVEQAQNIVAVADAAFDAEFRVSAQSSEVASRVLTAEVRRWLLDEASSGREVSIEIRGRWMLCDLGSHSAKLEARLSWFEWARRAGSKFAEHRGADA